MQQLHTIDAANTASSRAMLLYFVRADWAPAGSLSTLNSIQGWVNVSLVIALYNQWSWSSATMYLLFLSGESFLLRYWMFLENLHAHCSFITLLWAQSTTFTRVARQFWNLRGIHKPWGYWWNTICPSLQVHSACIVKLLCCTNLILFTKVEINEFKVLNWGLQPMENMMWYTTIDSICLGWLFMEKEFCLHEFFIFCIRQKLNNTIVSSCLVLIFIFYAPVPMWEKG